MKKLLVAVLALASVSAFAVGRSAEEVISEIEARDSVQCYQVSESRFKLCLGAPSELAVCRWTKKYDCFGASEFSVKLKLKSSASGSRGERETVVTKITYIR